MEFISKIAKAQIAKDLIYKTAEAIAHYQYHKQACFSELKTPGSVSAAVEIGYGDHATEMSIYREVALFHLRSIVSLFPTRAEAKPFLAEVKERYPMAYECASLELPF